MKRISQDINYHFALLRKRYLTTKKRMVELKAEYQFIMENMDITGGERGMKKNDRAYRRAEKIKQELLRLNRRLLAI